MKLSYLDWYESFTDILYRNKYDRPIDQQKAMTDFDNGMSPEDSASAFIQDLE
jgi:hypothetical protein